MCGNRRGRKRHKTLCEAIVKIARAADRLQQLSSATKSHFSTIGERCLQGRSQTSTACVRREANLLFSRYAANFTLYSLWRGNVGRGAFLSEMRPAFNSI